MKTVKRLVKILYFLTRMVSLPLIPIDKLYGGRPYTTVASVPAFLATVAWLVAPPQDSVIAMTAILVPGLLVSCLFGLWGPEFERERETRPGTDLK
jgi:hypothetical protein